MGKRIAVVGVGALGGYVGGWLAHSGEDVTLIDFWPENIETIRSKGLSLDGVTPEEKVVVKKAKTMHLTEMQDLSRQKPIDIAFVSMKSYDTEWATALIKQYLAPDGFVVSLQNCLNEERIANQVGWGKTVGMIASLISVDMFEPARIRRTVAIRRFSIKLGGEAVRVGQALGYHIEKIGKFEPETLAKAGEGDKAALDEVEAILRPGSNTNPNPRADIQRPSMAQDIRKGRRTEIEFMNGYIADRGNYIGVPAPTHAKLTEIVKKVERKEMKAAPALLGG